MKTKATFIKIYICLVICFTMALLSAAFLQENSIVANAEERNISTSREDMLKGSEYNDIDGRLTFDGMYFPINIEQYDYKELMTYDELVSIDNWLLSLGFSFYSANDTNWINSNYNKIIKKAISIGQLRNIFDPSSTRWGGYTHSLMMDKVFELLGTSNTIVEYLSDPELMVTYRYGEDFVVDEKIAKEALIDLAREPDFAEFIGGTHYYISYNATPSITDDYYKNKNGNYARSARSRLEDHYSSAITAYWNNDFDNSIRYLGYAIHYLMDIGNTAHACGIDSNGPGSTKPHSAYESYLEEEDLFNRQTFHATSSSIDDLYGVFEDDFTAVNDLSNIASNGRIPNGTTFYNAIKTERVGYDRAIYYDPVIEATLPVTEQYVAALLEQYYTDTFLAETTPTHRSKRVIKGNSVYFIKNLETGYYMDVKGWGTSADTKVQQFSFSGDTNQMFRAHYNDYDASFNFEPLHASNKRLTFSGSVGNPGDHLIIGNSSNSDSQKFKATYLHDGRYRILTAVDSSNGVTNALLFGPDYTKVLRVSPNDPANNAMYNLRQEISHFAFNPDSYNHYWTFEEVVELDATDTLYQMVFEEDKIYRIATTQNAYGNKTFTSQISSINHFQLGYRTGTNNANFYMQNEVSETDHLTAYLQKDKIYFLKVVPKKTMIYDHTFAINDSHAPNIHMLSTEIYLRFRTTTKQTFRVESAYPIVFYNSVGAVIPMDKRVEFVNNKWVYTVNFNANTDYNSKETYFIKVKGVQSNSFFVTDVVFTRLSFSY